MEQLPGGDAIFLAMETPNAPGHVGGLTVLDPSESPDFSFERVRQVIGERIALEPRFTRKLREVALGLDRPYLVDDPDFDVTKRFAVAPATLFSQPFAVIRCEDHDRFASQVGGLEEREDAAYVGVGVGYLAVI